MMPQLPRSGSIHLGIQPGKPHPFMTGRAQPAEAIIPIPPVRAYPPPLTSRRCPSFGGRQGCHNRVRA